MKRFSLVTAFAAAALAVSLLSAAPSHAQSYPTRPVKSRGAVRGRRAARSRRPCRVRETVSEPEATLRDGEPHRRRWQYRHRGGRQGGGGRLHAAVRPLRHADRQPGDVSQAAVQRGEGSAADLAAGRQQPDDGRASVAASEHARGVRRLREEGAARLCPCRVRQQRPSRDGIFPHHGRLRDRAGAVSRQRAAGDRSRRRAGEGRVSSPPSGSSSMCATAGSKDWRSPRPRVRCSHRTCRPRRKPAIRTSSSRPISSCSLLPACRMRSRSCSSAKSARC